MNQVTENNTNQNPSRLKQVRKHLGLTQSKLGESLEVPGFKIKDIERGVNKISTELALALEEKFNINFRWLLTGQGSMLLDSNNPNQNNQDQINLPYKDACNAACLTIENLIDKKNLIVSSEQKIDMVCSLFSTLMGLNK
jgi:DNA-binding XRE family transcriptional regulator